MISSLMILQWPQTIFYFVLSDDFYIGVTFYWVFQALNNLLIDTTCVSKSLILAFFLYTF